MQLVFALSIIRQLYILMTGLAIVSVAPQICGDVIDVLRLTFQNAIDLYNMTLEGLNGLFKLRNTSL